MLTDYFNEGLIEINANVKTPEEAIRSAGILLLNEGLILPEYIDSMIDNFHNLGPYIVIAPGIAIPHGKPGEMVKRKCISFCRLKEPIKFNHPANDPVSYVFAIGSDSSTDHLSLLVGLSGFLSKEENIKALSRLQCKDDFLELIKKGGQ